MMFSGLPTLPMMPGGMNNYPGARPPYPYMVSARCCHSFPPPIAKCYFLLYVQILTPPQPPTITTPLFTWGVAVGLFEMSLCMKKAPVLNVSPHSVIKYFDVGDAWMANFAMAFAWEENSLSLPVDSAASAARSSTWLTLSLLSPPGRRCQLLWAVIVRRGWWP